MADGYFVHPRGLCESTEVGAGTRVWAFAHVLKGAVVGKSCNIGECSFVEDGAVLGDHVTIKNGVQVWSGVTCADYVFVGPNATFTNDMRPRVEFPVDPEEFARTFVGRGASIGANATVVAGITIGSSAMLGAGTVIFRDVPDHALMVGNPARQVGWVCACGARVQETSSPRAECFVCGSCSRTYIVRSDGRGLTIQ